MEKLASRRLFLKKPFSNPTEETSLKREGNIVEIKTEDATYTIIYSLHNIPQDPAQIPQKCDGLFLEFADRNENPVLSLKQLGKYPNGESFNLEDSQTSFQQYKDLFPVLEQRRIPIFLADAGFTKTGNMVSISTLSILPILEIVLGLFNLNQLKLELSRRNFLKSAPKLLTGLWGISHIADSANLHPITSELGKTVIKVNEIIHPESYWLNLTLRNTLLAFKQQLLAKYLGDNPNFSTIIGGSHKLIEDELQTTLDEKWQKLYSWRGLLKTLIDPKMFTTIDRLDFNGTDWYYSNTYKIPPLESLFN